MKAAREWAPSLVAGVLAFSVYWLTLHPGVGDADAAELQYCSPILGICHPPGYSFVVLAGKLFSMLPIGGDVAWRVNLMTAVCGAVGVGLLCGAVRRMTASPAAGLCAALTLAFSSIYWTHSIAAEVYSFCGMLLIGGLYCLVRFIGERRVLWLYAAVLLLAACAMSRPSEVFVLPAFVAAWWVARKSAPVRVAQIAIAAGVVVMPFVATIAWYYARENPAELHARDDAMRDTAVDGPPLFHEMTGGTKFAEAVRYCLGLKWTVRTPTKEGQHAWDANKLVWLLSGAGLAADRSAADDAANRIKRIEQGRGGSIGLLGLLLAGFGCWAAFQSGRSAWLVLGAGMFVGNTVFYFWHHPPDNLEFTLPGLVGLAILVGLGVAGQPRADGRTPWWSWLALLVPAVLVAGNFSKLTQSNPATREIVSQRLSLGRALWPKHAIIVAPYMPAMTCRYVLHIDAGRRDVRVISVPGWYSPEQRTRLAEFVNTQPSVFLHQSLVDAATRSAATATTPAEIARLGFVALPQR